MTRSALILASLLGCACFSPPCSADDASENGRARGFEQQCSGGSGGHRIEVSEDGTVKTQAGQAKLMPAQVEELIRLAGVAPVGHSPEQASAGNDRGGYCAYHAIRPSGTREEVLPTRALVDELEAVRALTR